MRPNPEKDKITRAKYRDRNREKCRKLCKDWYSRNKHMAKEYELKKNYGITMHDYKLLIETQNGLCAVCSGPPAGGYDDHATGRIRGLLCNTCNRGLGLLKDNKELLQKAINYL